MFKQFFGTNGQIQFANEHEYFKFLGFLAKSDGSTSLVWEHNEEQGAWGSEGRIQIYTSNLPNGMGTFCLSAGVGSVKRRLNCNDFVQNIAEDHNFIMGSDQNEQSILNTIPDAFKEDFDKGYNA